ncbi:isopentenyl-diphosphate Delta-isomerase [Candidatus Gottesmanbacteria bacterium]|nr:isopentenyl-diphosphate Delta-isomerase [Candidatus Gottesmanbacteria bacterium]
MEQVVLVDKNDNNIGLMEKLAAHQGSGHLHRAVSVLLYRKKNGKTEILLQQRSKNKPLWPLYWSNTVCTHPCDGELPINCAVRRLKEEMGITVKPENLRFIFTLLYQAKYNDDLSEHELDNVFVGEWDGEVELNNREVESCRWFAWNELQKNSMEKSQQFTPWFNLLVKKIDISTLR